MKRNEKGYSLIELIVTLAVFSILMVALIMMLRTSMASYREGLFETEMQEEVQITANQVSEFLIDAYSFDKQVANHDIGGGVKVDAYSFNGPDGDFTLVYSPSEHSLFYYEKKFDDIDWSNTNKIYRNLVSDKVYDTSEGKGFAIVGLNKRSSKDDKNFQDNEATIKVNIESHGRSYAAEKDVYFRNNIEDSIPKVEADDPDNYMTFAAENMDIEDNVSTGGVHDVALMRYDELDLSREFGIVYGVNSDDYNGKGFIMINPDAPGKAIGNGVNNEISNTFKAAHPDKKYEHYVLKVDPTLETFDSYKLKKDKILITGYDVNDTKIEVYVHLDAVSIEVGSKVLKTFVDSSSTYGCPTDITVKGINIEEAMKDGVTLTYDAEFKKGNASQGTYSKVGVKACPADQLVKPGDSVTEITNGWGFEIFSNVNNKNMILVVPKDCKKGHGDNDSLLFDNFDKTDTATNKKNNLKITFYFNDEHNTNKRVSGIKDELVYEVYPQGKYVTNAGK